MTAPLVAVLLYGDYPSLADRCLRSVMSQTVADRCTIAVWCNEVSNRVLSVVGDRLRTPERLAHVYSSGNIRKYPAMRKLLYDCYPAAERFVWLDDDAYFTSDDALSRLLSQLDSADLVGWLHTMPYRPGQREWIAGQPWYSGRRRERFTFAQGSCWAARAARLRAWWYPWPELLHCGGDSMLGELAFQQDWRIRHTRDGFRVNADETGAVNKSQRRGFSEPEIGSRRWYESRGGSA